MKKDSKTIVKEVIMAESEAIKNLANLVTNEFSEVIDVIFESKGRVVVTGIGKSAIIGSKIVATLNSTGTPSVFMHAADAIHGDLGNVQKDDVVICISKSGNTPEIKVLVPLVKNLGSKVVALTGNISSFLGVQSDYILNAYVEREVCPNNLAPTTSTTAQLVLGDALAVALIEKRSFGTSDFAKYHPGGALGKKLYLGVEELASNNEKPSVSSSAGLKSIILEISKKRLGVTAVLDDNGMILGIVTDGDLRRMLEQDVDYKTVTAIDIMSENPKTVSEEALAVEALGIMEENDITQLLVEKNGVYKGVVHLHDLIKEGII
ncbi:MAG: KpsF/GutQ family sugar-phosphate isomerase [Ichthyobacteriaceae bacterium]|nr:KpsF/GutQ family sugar-phosphate isomerase [Ichthyobacteriaceae bacterium]